MDPGRWKALESAFHAIADSPAHQRSELLAMAAFAAEEIELLRGLLEADQRMQDDELDSTLSMSPDWERIRRALESYLEGQVNGCAQSRPTLEVRDLP